MVVLSVGNCFYEFYGGLYVVIDDIYCNRHVASSVCLCVCACVSVHVCVDIYACVCTCMRVLCMCVCVLCDAYAFGLIRLGDVWASCADASRVIESAS